MIKDGHVVMWIRMKKGWLEVNTNEEDELIRYWRRKEVIDKYFSI